MLLANLTEVEKWILEKIHEHGKISPKKLKKIKPDIHTDRSISYGIKSLRENKKYIKRIPNLKHMSSVYYIINVDRFDSSKHFNLIIPNTR